MKSPRQQALLRICLALGILVAVVGGYYVARYHAWAAYRNWSIARMNGMARDFIAAGDPRNALLTVRKVLGKRPNDVEAWRLGVAAARQRDTAEVIHYQRNLRRVDPTPENQLELIRLALRYRVYSVALQAVTTATKDVGDLPEFHRLAAEVYRLIGRETTARYHLASLLTLEPGDTAAQLGLAEIEFESDGTKVAADWAERVARLAQRPATELPATMLQLRMAVARRNAAVARPLLARMRDRVDLDIRQRLHVLEAVELVAPAEAGPALAQVQRQAAAQPADTTRVMAWLAAQSRPDAIIAWYPQLPEAGRNDEAVKLHLARALEASRDWPALEQLVRGPKWKIEDAQRLALLARAYRMTGRSGDFAESWKLALIALGSDPRAGVRLLQAIEPWGWADERRDVLWKIFNQVPANRAVREELITHEFSSGNTVNLNKIFARIIEATPDDDEARNNFAYTSLLLDTNLGRAQSIGRDLHRKYPENVSYLTTYTLALHKDGRSGEALEMIDALPAATRMALSVALHEAAYAAASGHIKRAADLLPLLAPARMLPEESQLVAATRLAVTREGVRADRQQALAATSSVPAAGGWLAWLPDVARDAPHDLREADALYRGGNFPALVELTQAGTWKDHEHLRQALLAYARRQQAGEGAARDAWRQALGAAGRDSRRLRELTVLASHWQWPAERMEAQARRFERESTDAALLAELLDYYRQQNRTPDLARTLWLYVNATKTAGPEAAWCVYYSLLCDMNVNSAQTLAQRVFAAAPQDGPGRVAYAFALWRQRRPAEAWDLLQNIDAEKAAGMQVALVAAGVLLELDRKQDAQKSLARFVPLKAMPEERILADTLSRKAGLESATITLTSNVP